LLLALLCVVGCKGTGSPQSGEQQPPSNRPNTTTVSRGSGGSVTTNLGYNIKVNPNSTLEREWVTAHDSLSPADLVGTVGVITAYKDGGTYSSGEYRYRATVPINFREDVTAIEVRFVLFDIWGQFTKTLTSTEVEDVAAGTTKTFTPEWTVYDENTVSEHYASIAYVARVRTKSGRVFEADYGPVVAEAKKLNARFEPGWLDPLRRTGADSTRGTR
jgi:hypothetical protein